MSTPSLDTILKRLEAACAEARGLGYVHMPILIGIMDLFEAGHIAPTYAGDVAERAAKWQDELSKLQAVSISSTEAKKPD